MSKRPRNDSSPLDRQESVPTSPDCLQSELDSPTAKVVAIDGMVASPIPTMRCDLPPHGSSLEFPSIDAFEIHYAQVHTHRCSSCGANLPSAHFLDLHIDENHNPLREELASKGEKTFACLLPDCERKCSTPQKRRLHVIDKHHFPKFYNFRIIDQGLDNATSVLQDSRRRRRVSTDIRAPVGPSMQVVPRGISKFHDSRRLESTQESKQRAVPRSTMSRQSDLKQEDEDDIIGELETSFSALTFIPRSVIQRGSTGGSDRYRSSSNTSE